MFNIFHSSPQSPYSPSVSPYSPYSPSHKSIIMSFYQQIKTVQRSKAYLPKITEINQMARLGNSKLSLCDSNFHLHSSYCASRSPNPSSEHYGKRDHLKPFPSLTLKYKLLSSTDQTDPE